MILKRKKTEPLNIATIPSNAMAAAPHVVIVGAGFAGLHAARGLGEAPVRVTVIDRTNHHVFQPLLYQVATASLSPADISAPIRGVLGKQNNTEVLLAEVTGVDVQGQHVLMHDRSVPYDYLILATGVQHNYFGHDEWRQFAPGLKTLQDATAIRHKILLSFEAAEQEKDPEKYRPSIGSCSPRRGRTEDPADVSRVSCEKGLCRTHPAGCGSANECRGGSCR